MTSASPMAPTDPTPRGRATRLWQQFGKTATGAQTLAPGRRLHLHASGHSYAAYTRAGRHWVVATEPVGADDVIDEHVRDIVQLAQRNRHRVSFFATERRPPPDSTLTALAIGRQPWLKPEDWPETLRKVRSLREQLRRARARDVLVQRVASRSLSASQRSELATLIGRWQQTKPLPPMAFLVELNLLDDGVPRELFLARRRGNLVGFAAAAPIPSTGSWFVEHLIRSPAAPNGVSELLMDALLRAAAESDASEVSLGLAPLAGELPGALRTAREVGRPLYDFAGLERFKAKFRPQRWQTIYLWYPATQSPALSMVDSLAAFAGGSLLRYAWRATLRGPSPLVRALWLLLIPWTMLLALSDAERWFPWVWLKWFWVGYDVVAIALFIWAGRSRSIAVLTGLIALTFVDSVLSSVSVLGYNAARVRTGSEALVLLAGSLAPAFATLVLLGRRRRLVSLFETLSTPDLTVAGVSDFPAAHAHPERPGGGRGAK